jgi:hypothetical protein
VLTQKLEDRAWEPKLVPDLRQHRRAGRTVNYVQVGFAPNPGHLRAVQGHVVFEIVKGLKAPQQARKVDTQWSISGISFGNAALLHRSAQGLPGTAVEIPVVKEEKKRCGLASQIGNGRHVPVRCASKMHPRQSRPAGAGYKITGKSAGQLKQQNRV